MKKFFSLGIIISLGIGQVACQQTGGGVTVAPKEFAKNISDYKNEVILDVRTPEEFSQGHLAQAININWNGANFETEVAKLKMDVPVLVYCKVGGRSAAAAKKLKSLGFKNVIELKGGIDAWQNQLLPIVKN